LIEMKFEDDLMHLWWKNRTTGVAEDELIVFPGEATFEKVQQDPSGRTHILKFSSSDQSYFFWFQRANKDTDLRAQVDINAFLQDPTYRAGSAPLPEPAAPSTPTAAASSSRAGGLEDRSWPPTPGAPKLSHPEPLPPSASSLGASSSAAATGMQLDQPTSSTSSAQEEMARLLMQWAQSGGLGSSAGGSTDDPARLTDVLSPTTITALVNSDPSIGSRLKPLLPANLNLPENPTAKDLIPVLTAPQLTDAIASLDNALRSGGLPGGMMRDLGLPESAGQSVSAFLEALKGLKQDGGDDKMDTDD